MGDGVMDGDGAGGSDSCLLNDRIFVIFLSPLSCTSLACFLVEKAGSLGLSAVGRGGGERYAEEDWLCLFLSPPLSCLCLVQRVQGVGTKGDECR